MSPALVLVAGLAALLGHRLALGPNSIETFQLEKPIEFWLEIPYVKKMVKNV